jgi:phosphoglycolate phosphatase
VTIRAVLLDLDGTLADTAPDLVAVLNRLLLEHGRPRMPYAIARNEVSNGALGLLRLGFGEGGDSGEREALRARFLELYARNVCVNSRLFIDLKILYDSLPEIAWGVVTNKPEALTHPLIEGLGLSGLACVVGGDRLPQRKPHPAPLLLAAAEIGVPPERCVYVGDAPRDVAAGRAAGMATIVAAYGYIRPGEPVAGWGADAVIRHPAELDGALASLESRWAA